jgi:hypothetical protein
MGEVNRKYSKKNMIYTIEKVEKGVEMKGPGIERMKGWRYTIKIVGIKKQLILESPLGILSRTKMEASIKEEVIGKMKSELEKDGINLERLKTPR